MFPVCNSNYVVSFLNNVVIVKHSRNVWKTLCFEKEWHIRKCVIFIQDFFYVMLGSGLRLMRAEQVQVDVYKKL